MNKRLMTALAYIRGHRVLADIGSDHGYLPIEAVKTEAVTRAIASDLREKPLRRAMKNIQKAHLEDRIDTVCGDGLEVLSDDVDVVAVLGMGGITMRDVLSGGDLSGVERLVLSPNSRHDIVRKWLENHAFAIVDEAYIRDAGHDYVIIVAEHGSMSLSADEREFGPCILRDRPDDFVRMIEDHIIILENARKKTRSRGERDRLDSQIESLRELIA